MRYFAWMLEVGFAVLLAIMSAVWGDNEAGRADAAERSSGLKRA